MALFEGPEYASFISLCRELRLEWKPAAGDWFWWPELPERDDDWWRKPGVYLYDPLVDEWHGGWGSPDQLDSGVPGWPEHAVPLPRLDQWLAMLEEAGARSLTLELLPPDEDHPTATWNCGGRGTVGVGRTREEAAARLWCAVTGRQLTA